jgi:hypothetical protein
MIKFEFFHSQSGEYFMGEKRETGFWIKSNFMINEFEIITTKGSLTYNQDLEVEMKVNQRKYSYIEL